MSLLERNCTFKDSGRCVSYSTIGGRYSIQLEISFSWGDQLTKWAGGGGDVEAVMHDRREIAELVEFHGGLAAGARLYRAVAGSHR